MEIDRMFIVLFNSVSPEVIDSIPCEETAGLVLGMWNEFNPNNKLQFDQVLRRAEEIYAYRKELKRLREQPYIAQRSEEWYALRRQRLTASDIAQAIGKGKFGTRDQLIQKKAAEMAGRPQPFRVMQAMKWGIMFEDMAMRCYQQRNNNVTVYDFGMIPHPTLSCFGASPDGITDLGIMTEIKCPFKRKITGEVPDYYELQMQGQMAVCNLRECDYIECEMQVFDSFEDYELMADGRTDHGIISEFVRDGETFYEYSYPYLTASEANTMMIEMSTRKMRTDLSVHLVNLHYWKLKQISIQRIHFDEERWATLVPGITKFWNDVISAYDVIKNASQGNEEEDIQSTHAEKKKYKFIKDSDDDEPMP